MDPDRDYSGGTQALPPLEITDQEFALFQTLIQREAGIHLAPGKRAMLVCRLMRRVYALKLTSFGEYYRHVLSSGQDEMVRLLDAVCTNETWFFRNLRHFTFVRDTLCPRWRAEAEAGRRYPRISAWSAACSSGEEPFSLAMVLLDALPGWTLEIVASDLSSRVLERARAATWPVEKSGDIPAPYLKRYMLRGIGVQAGKMRAGPEIQRLVAFRRLNLNEPSLELEPETRFDLIFCRNVLMYFDATNRDRALRRIVTRLVPGGHLFLGDTEGLGRFEGLSQVAAAVHVLVLNAAGSSSNGEPTRDRREAL